MNITLRLGFAAAAVCCSLSAQTNEETPITPVVSLSIDGPAQIQQDFLATTLGSLLAAQEAETYRQATLAPLRGLIGMVSRGGGDDADKTVEQLSRYRGRIAFELIPESTQSFVENGIAGVAAVLTIERQPDLPVEDLLRPLAEFALSHVPAKSTRVEFVDPPESSPRSRQTRAASIDLRADLAQLISWMSLHEAGGDDDRAIIQTLGFHTLDSVHLSVRPRGPNTLFESRVRFKAGADDTAKGLFAGLLATTKAAPSLGHLVPESASTWQDVQFGAFDVVHTALAAFESWDIRDSIHDDLGLHLDHDILAHLSSEVLAFGNGDENNPVNFLATFFLGHRADIDAGYVVPITDPEAFAASWSHLADELGIAAEQPTQIAGVDAHICEVGRVHCAHACVEDHFVVTTGAHAETWLRDVIAKLQATDTKPQQKSLTRLRRDHPDFLNGHGRVSVQEFVSDLDGIASMFDFPFLGPFRSLFELTDEAGDDTSARGQTRHPLHHAHILIGVEDDTHVTRVLW